MSGTRRSLPWVVVGAGGRALRRAGRVPRERPLHATADPHRLLAIAAVFKLVYLLAGAAWAFACRDRLEAGNPARPAWFLLSLGLLATFAGQLSLAPFQLVSGETPFPTRRHLLRARLPVPDRGARSCSCTPTGEAGFPIGSLAERAAILAVASGGGRAVAVILRPVAAPRRARSSTGS